MLNSMHRFSSIRLKPTHEGKFHLVLDFHVSVSMRPSPRALLGSFDHVQQHVKSFYRLRAHASSVAGKSLHKIFSPQRAVAGLGPGTAVAFSLTTLAEREERTNFDRYWKGKYKIRLYQYEVCPFCNKARAYMEYHRIPFERIEVNPLTKEQVKFQDYKRVPFC